MGLIEDAVKGAADVLAPEAAVPARVGAWLLGDAWRLVALGALVAVGVQELRIEGVKIAPKAGPFHFTLIDLPGWKPRAVAAEKALAARDKQIADMQFTERTALAAQIAANHQPAADSRVIAEQANAQDKQSRPAILAAAVAYAAAHHVPECVRNAAAAQADGDTGHGGVPGADQPASGGGGANLPPGMVAISQADFDGYNRNTADLDALRAAIARLINAGWVHIED